MAPIIIAVTTFSVYAGIFGSDQLNVPKVVAVLGYMNLMRLPMALTPKMLGAFVDSLVSYKRVGVFLFQGDEIKPRKPFHRTRDDDTTTGYSSSENEDNKTTATAAAATAAAAATTTPITTTNIVRIRKGSIFSWSKESHSTTDDGDEKIIEAVAEQDEGSTTTANATNENKQESRRILHTESEDLFGETKLSVDEKMKIKNRQEKQDEFQLKINSQQDFIIPKGSLVIICGKVGSGKSSLISAILGEMKEVENTKERQLTPTVTVNGTVALVAQKAWIQNATVRNAILFGGEYNKKLYNNVLDASELRKDIDILQHGDMTEIGKFCFLPPFI